MVGSLRADDAVRILVERGLELLAAPPKEVQFSDEPAVNRLLNDLSGHPHAFVLACIMDRGIKAERAWAVPYKLSERLGDFTFNTLVSLSLEEIKSLMRRPTPLHRFLDTMSEALHAGIHHIADQYDGDASQIWIGSPPSAEVVYRFLQFRGIGPKIANMAANILARDFKIDFLDHYSIDISPDVHVRRVFGRLGFCAQGASAEQVIYRARALYPRFPGVMDLPCFEVGRKWCSSQKPKCAGCYMQYVCPSRTSP